MTEKGYFIRAGWDDDARVWYTEESDVPGLVVEAGNFEEFVSEARELMPQLLRLNGELPNETGSVPLRVIRDERVRLAS